MLSALHKSTLTRIAQAHQIRDARRSKMATEEKYMGKLDGKSHSLPKQGSFSELMV